MKCEEEDFPAGVSEKWTATAGAYTLWCLVDTLGPIVVPW